MIKIFVFAYITKNNKYGASLIFSTNLNDAIIEFKNIVPNYLSYDLADATQSALAFFDYKKDN